MDSVQDSPRPRALISGMLRAGCVLLSLLCIGAGPETKPASTDILKALQQLPADYRPDSTGNFNSYTIQKASDWLYDHCLDSIVTVPITVDRVIGPVEKKASDEWEMLVIPKYAELRIFGAPGLIQLRSESLHLVITDAQAKEASQWKAGKKLVLRGRINAIKVGPQADDDESVYYPRLDRPSFNAIYRLDLRECTYDAR